MLFVVGDALLQDFLPPGPTCFKIHEYCCSLNFFLTITVFALAVHVLEKSDFKHASVFLAVFILVVFQVLAEFNRPKLPPLSDSKREDEEI